MTGGAALRRESELRRKTSHMTSFEVKSGWYNDTVDCCRFNVVPH